MSFRRTPLPGRPVRNRESVDPAEERTQAVALNASIGIAATIVVGQLWAITVALDAWLGRDSGALKWILLFQCLSFVIALGIWFLAPKGRG